MEKLLAALLIVGIIVLSPLALWALRSHAPGAAREVVATVVAMALAVFAAFF